LKNGLLQYHHNLNYNFMEGRFKQIKGRIEKAKSKIFFATERKTETKTLMFLDAYYDCSY